MGIFINRKDSAKLFLFALILHFFTNTRMLTIRMHFVQECWAMHIICKHMLSICLQIVCVCSAFAYQVHAYAEHSCTKKPVSRIHISLNADPNLDPLFYLNADLDLDSGFRILLTGLFCPKIKKTMENFQRLLVFLALFCFWFIMQKNWYQIYTC